jgi:putative transposase
MFVIVAYCVMPDHGHLILPGASDTSDLRRCVKLMKQRVEYIARRRFCILGLGQDGYYERVLQSRFALETAVRYVLENPVRAGLATRIDEYPLSGAPSAL